MHESYPVPPADTASRRAAQMAEVRDEFDKRMETGATDDWGPIPRYAMLDIWMALYGSDRSEEFGLFADEHGYADTWAQLCARVRLIRRPGFDPNALTFSEETMFKVQAAITAQGIWGQKALDIIGAMQNAGILFRERANRVTDQEEHTHYTDRARRLCAEGDHDSAELWDRDAERVKVREHEAREEYRASHADEPYDQEGAQNAHAQELREEAVRHIAKTFDIGEDVITMAEEPIEHRLRRAWLNGFKEGVERASYSASESWGRWDS